MMRNIIVLFLVILAVSQYYEDDKVHYTVANYTGYDWYSGRLKITQGICPLGKKRNIIMSSSHRSTIQIWTHWLCGIMEGQGVRHF